MIKQRMKFLNSKFKILNSKEDGAALLVVLFVIMAITILSLGFLSRSDVELACGQNMILRTQMDYLAESGLEHAKGLILNPQDVPLDELDPDHEYWVGRAGLQLDSNTNDFYDVNIVRDDSDLANRCNYIIDCNAYRLKGGEEVGRSSLTAELRLDPCIAFWTVGVTTIFSGIKINGDVYCDNNLTIVGTVNGDVFAAGVISAGGSVAGQRYAYVPSPPVSSPGLVYSDFSSQYYYNGSGPYSVKTLWTLKYDSWFPEPGSNNPACVYYRDGDLELNGNININGMLVVKDDLKLKENCNVTITAVKDFPALLVGDELRIENNSQILNITGLAQIDNRIDMKNKTGSLINVMGALCITGDSLVNTIGCTINITAFPDKAAIEMWPTVDTANRWTPAAGAFFRSIQRK